MPVLRIRLAVDAPAGVALHHAVHLLPGAEVREVAPAGRVGFTLEHGPTGELPRDVAYLPPTVAAAPLVQFSTGESWAALARGYAALVEPVVVGADAAALLRGVDTHRPREEVIAQVLARLHRAVRYTGIEFGESRLVPHRPADTIAQGFGDCKDKSLALVTALRAAGIPAQLALLRTGPGLDTDASLPGMGVFDHAIVYVGGEQPLWIDATAQSARVGDLPFMDRDRRALVIADGTSELISTPQATSEHERIVETREFMLAELGSARVVETTETYGDAEAEYRDLYGGAKTDTARKKLEDYAKSVYRADALTGYEADAATDFRRPHQLRLDVAGAWRGTTGMSDASVWIPLGGIYGRLPEVVRKADAKAKDAKTPARTDDYVFMPFVTEWRYRIVLPPGFVVAALPSPSVTAIGPGKLSQQFATQPDGVVSATIRFDSVTGRYTADDVAAVQAKVAEIGAAPSVALATLAMTYARHGAPYVAIEARSMMSKVSRTLWSVIRMPIPRRRR